MPDIYEFDIITPDKKDELLDSINGKKISIEKAYIHGMCIELITDDKEFKEFWQDNFHHITEHIRPHGRVIAINHPDYGKSKFLYEPMSKTCFVMNCDYYGYVKSIALAVAADFLEDYHSLTNRHSIHGSCIDIRGQGLVIIAPSNTGKTTHSFGLLLYKNASLVSDDWLFVRMKKDTAIAYASERNSYIRDDIGKNWKIFQPLVDNAILDKKGRGIASVQDVIGRDRTRETTTIKSVFILKRDSSDERVIYKLSPEEAIDYISNHYYCNPYQMVRNDRKIKLRTNFFMELFSMVSVYMVNTVKPPEETQGEIRKLVDKIFM